MKRVDVYLKKLAEKRACAAGDVERYAKASEIGCLLWLIRIRSLALGRTALLVGTASRLMRAVHLDLAVKQADVIAAHQRFAKFLIRDIWSRQRLGNPSAGIIAKFAAIGLANLFALTRR